MSHWVGGRPWVEEREGGGEKGGGGVIASRNDIRE